MLLPVPRSFQYHTARRTSVFCSNKPPLKPRRPLRSLLLHSTPQCLVLLAGLDQIPYTLRWLFRLGPLCLATTEIPTRVPQVEVHRPAHHFQGLQLVGIWPPMEVNLLLVLHRRSRGDEQAARCCKLPGNAASRPSIRTTITHLRSKMYGCASSVNTREFSDDLPRH